VTIQVPPNSTGPIVDTTTVGGRERQIVQVEGIGSAGGAPVIVQPGLNAFVTGQITEGGTGPAAQVVIPCMDATQVWGRVYGTFVATWRPEVAAVDDNAVWSKVDIWELETRRYFNTSSGGRVFLFSDLMGAALARIRVAVGDFTSGPVLVDLRTLHSNPMNPRMIWYPEEVLADGYGKLTAPTAGTVIAAVNNPGEGVYEVEVIAYYKGAAPAAADDSNLGLYSGGTLIGRIPMPRLNDERGHRLFRYVDVTSSTNDLEVKAIGSATTGVIYEVLLSAQRLF